MEVACFTGGTLKLTEHNLAFAESSLDWVRDGDIGQYMGVDFSTVSVQTEIDRIREILSNEDEYNWVIVLDGKAIGALSINGITKSSQEYSAKAGSLTFLIGYPAYRGRGIASAVIHQLLSWAFEEAAFAVITARALEENTASQKTLLRLGFEPCGTEPYDGLVHGHASRWKKYRLKSGRNTEN